MSPLNDHNEPMQEVGYLWSNEAQTYYDFNYEHISRKSAERLYKYLVGNKEFCKPLREDKLENNNN